MCVVCRDRSAFVCVGRSVRGFLCTAELHTELHAEPTD